MMSRKLHVIVFERFFAALLLAACSLFAQTPSFTTFDAPGAGTFDNHGTMALYINSKGVITGIFQDDSGISHGFVRDATGVITDFDFPGSNNTDVFGINSRGQIIGSGSKGSFLRTTSGHFFHIHVPGAVATQPNGINDLGQIAGSYDDAAVFIHGFLRDTDGTYTLFDDPDARSDGGTVPLAINNNGQIAGYYHSQGGKLRAFVRDSSGNFTNFDPTSQTVDTLDSIAINASGEIVGRYVLNNKSVGFVRDPAGTITTFSPPGGKNIFPTAINDSGVVVGHWTDINVTRGFTRDAAGNVATFSAPVPNHGTSAYSINNTGRITGYYIDSDGVAHGFVR
jgi:uncharacterized membrane protein